MTPPTEMKATLLLSVQNKLINVKNAITTLFYFAKKGLKNVFIFCQMIVEGVHTKIKSENLITNKSGSKII